MLIPFIAIAAAFHKAHIYHRDLSKENIMMAEERANHTGPRGVLNDWDRAIGVNVKAIGRTVCILILHRHSPH